MKYRHFWERDFEQQEFRHNRLMNTCTSATTQGINKKTEVMGQNEKKEGYAGSQRGR